jgi:hypothetical protein
MERMTRNMRTFCPDQHAVRLGMMLGLVGYMLPDADVWGDFLPKYLPDYMPDSYRTALDAEFTRVCDPEGAHRALHFATFRFDNRFHWE